MIPGQGFQLQTSGLSGDNSHGKSILMCWYFNMYIVKIYHKNVKLKLDVLCIIELFFHGVSLDLTQVKSFGFQIGYRL